MSIVDDNIISNSSSNETFEEVLENRMSRRGFMGLTAAAGAFAAVSGGIGSLVGAVPAPAVAAAKKRLLGFTGISALPGPGEISDTIRIAPGYTAKVLIAWGDPVSDGPEFAPDASNTADEQAQQWGMHNDGIVYFPMRGRGRDDDDDDDLGDDDDDDDRRGGPSDHGLIVQNSEYTDDVLLFPDGLAGWNAEKTAKSQNAHGVNIIEVKKRRGRRDDDDDDDDDFGGRRRGRRNDEWEVVRPSQYARRITAQTPMTIGGPAAGDPLLRTAADPTGTHVLGTANNCAMGFTPWGTYLACEENFNGYFRKTGDRTQLEMRYGITAGGFGYLWHTTDTRFNANIEPNEPNRFGYVVEIDPFDPDSTPVKRSALGRFKHEGAWVQEARDGRVVVYSGDDEQFEYIYRYVSADKWKRMIRNGVSPLDEGTLYVAKFNSNGKGEWLPLTPDNPALAGWTLAEILINTRTAADLVGATKMDRPEWIDTFPDTLTGIATLTNNSRRGATGFPAADASNPRSPNTYGHIIRWWYRRDWTENTFRWDIFALAGDPAVPSHNSNIVGDKYGSPDGIYVAPSGRLWIQTDVSGSTINSGAYAGFGNNQMLCADPRTRETRRFLVGPNVCEVTGVFVTPDEKTMFVGIQHPGEAPSGNNDPNNPTQYSAWPRMDDGSPGPRPRSSLLVVTKDDGGEIGS